MDHVANFLILCGAAVMVFNIVRFSSVRKRLQAMPVEVFGARPPASGMLLVLMGFFLAGYVFVFCSNLIGLDLAGAILVGLIFFFGAIFVLQTVLFQHHTITLIQNYLDALTVEKHRLAEANASLQHEMGRRQQLYQELQGSETRFRLLAEASFEGILICTDEEILEVNDSLCRIFRIGAEKLLGAYPFDLLHPHSRAYFESRMQQGDELPFECLGSRPDGTLLTLEIRKRSMEYGGRNRLVLALRDISDRKEMEELLRHEAMHDPLTGLANRSLCLDRIRQAMARALRKINYNFALVFLDLDRFKVINDSLGHVVGDKLLCEVSERIVQQVREFDTVARFGGDEFILLLEECPAKQAIQIVKRLRARLKEPYRIDGHVLQLNASFGLLLGPVANATPEQMLQNANVAMHQAKARGRDRIKVFRAGMLAKAVEIMTLENDIRRGLSKREFVLHYQPVVGIGAQDRLSGWEALVRWNHPGRGFVSPADFIPIAEETGLIGELGKYVLVEACRQLRHWLDTVPGVSTAMRMSVNLSAQQISQPGIIGVVRQALEETGVPPQNITLEITESAVMENPESALNKIAQLKRLGVQIAIDDFGTGYSSLAYLERFPADSLKIDRSFIGRIEQQSKNSSIVSAIIVLAHSLNLQVVAEGVEERVQLDLLRVLGCDLVQGYFYSRPLPADQALELLCSDTLLAKGR